MSPDSPIMQVWGSRGDPAWFFTCGKAWMEGLTPYVDFADSKGILLWLLNGIAYLISPTDYVGVFCISVLCYAVTFYFLWRISRLFVSRRLSLLILSVMSVVIMFRPVHPETKAEDFCLPWICTALYYTCALLQSPLRGEIRRGAFLTGVGMIWCLLVKWNVFFMMGGMAIVIAGISFKKGWIDGLAFGLLGMAITALPFVVYFLIAGNFSAFVQEYFVNTFVLTDNGAGADAFHSALLNQFSDKYMILRSAILYASLVGVCLFCWRLRFSYWLVFAYLPFFLFLLLKTSALHYCSTIEPFLVFPLIVVMLICSRRVQRLSAYTVCFMSGAIYLLGIIFGMHSELLCFVDNPYTQEWNAIQSIMGKKLKPKIMYNVCDYGYGTPSRALPACKYWARQKLATPEMDSLRVQAIRMRKPDFFCGGSNISADVKNFLQSCGYRQCFFTVREGGKSVRKPLPLYIKE